ncbi:MAG: hypothetical protein R3315_02020 [Woeseiaceae bacterium]|nr:hypothetical protein [Woeseiaceae bacterium]
MNIRMPLLAFLTLLLSGVALAQDPQVDSANPSSAPQGTQLDVEIGGNGFDNSAAVNFFVTGTTNPGGITVTNVKVRGPKKIIASITIDAEAEVTDFDIEVALSRGRTGKGTELFSVQENTNQGRGENASAIATILTQTVSVSVGVFSDLWDPDAGTGNPRYVALDLDGAPDPDGGGSLTGDCVHVIVPVEDGVDRGGAKLFAPNVFGCPPLRQTLVRDSGYDLDKNGSVEFDEYVYHRFICQDVFSKQTIVGESSQVDCTMTVREITPDNDLLERTWRIEWIGATAVHDSADVRTVYGTDADIYELVAPDKGKGRKSPVLRERKYLPITIKFHRIRY